MNTTGQNYQGFKPYALDPKCRVSVPPAWRPEAGEVLYLLSTFTHELPMIKVLSKANYEARLERVRNSDLTPGKKQKKLGALAMLSREVFVNDQGKLAIPRDLCEEAELKPDSEIVLAGRLEHFELWNAEHHKECRRIERKLEEEDDLDIF